MGKDHYDKIRDLGGTNGAFLAVDKQNSSHKVVIKRLDSMEELSVSLRLRHSNIVRVLESFIEEDGTLYVVAEYEEGGDLDSFLSRLSELKKQPTYETTLLWFSQLIEAVAFCHENRVMHRDIKPGNIFLSKDTKTLFLGDFGSAKLMQNAGGDMTSTFIGSPLWLSPEVLLGEKYSFSSDMWSLGCVLYEIVAGHRPFSATSFARLVQDVTGGKVIPLPDTVPEPLRKLILSMLVVNPAGRITAAAALEEITSIRQQHMGHGEEVVTAPLVPPLEKEAVVCDPPQQMDLSPSSHIRTKQVIKQPPASIPRITKDTAPPPLPPSPQVKEMSHSSSSASSLVHHLEEESPPKEASVLHADSAPSSTTHTPIVDSLLRRPAGSADEARPKETGEFSLWAAHQGDFASIEAYLGQFREHDYEVLKTQREREERERQRASSPKVVKQAARAPLKGPSPPPQRPSPSRRPRRPPPQVIYSKPVKQTNPRPTPMKQRHSTASATTVPKRISMAHHPRQSSHARSPPHYSPEELGEIEAAREAHRAKREAERSQMKALIQQRRAAKRKGEVDVQIVLPDQLEYTDNGIVPLHHR